MERMMEKQHNSDDNVIWLELLKRVEAKEKVPVTVATFKRTEP